MKKIILVLLIYLLMFAKTIFCDERFEIIEKELQISGNEFKINIDIDAAKLIITRSDKSDVCFVYIKYKEEGCKTDFNYDENEGELDIFIDNIDLIDRDDHDYHFNTDKNSSDLVKVIIKLPFKPQIDLKTKIKAGDLNYKLGDIHLRNFRIKNWAGEVEVDFDKPNRTVLEFLDIGCKFGEFEIKNIGNAHCGEADINSGIGELLIDFRGEFIMDMMAYVDLDIGETTIIIPRNINTRMKLSKLLFLSDIDYPDWFTKRGKYYYSRNYTDDESSLFLDVSTGIGELRIKVRE